MAEPATQLLRLLGVALLVYGVVAALAFVYAERVLFQPPPASYSPASLDYATIASPDGPAIAVQHLPHPEARFTILLSHGNAEDLGHLQPFLHELRRAGFAVIAYDYRGYGRSGGGRPTVRGAVADAETVYAYAVGPLRVRQDRLILHGRSLGAGPTLELATRRDAAGVVLESAFASVYRVMTGWPLLPFDRFPNLRRVRSLDRPVLVIHGERDRVIRVSHGRALFATARGPKRALWVERAGHNDLALVGGQEYFDALRDFAATLPR